MTSQELFEQMEQHWLSFKENHERFQEKQVKAAGVRARKSINELKNYLANIVQHNWLNLKINEFSIRTYHITYVTRNDL